MDDNEFIDVFSDEIIISEEMASPVFVEELLQALQSTVEDLARGITAREAIIIRQRRQLDDVGREMNRLQALLRDLEIEEEPL